MLSVLGERADTVLDLLGNQLLIQVVNEIRRSFDGALLVEQC